MENFKTKRNIFKMVNIATDTASVVIIGSLIGVMLGTKTLTNLNTGEVWRRNNLSQPIARQVPLRVGRFKLPVFTVQKTMRQPLEAVSVSPKLRHEADLVRPIIIERMEEELFTERDRINEQRMVKIFNFVVQRMMGYYMYRYHPEYFATRPDLVNLYRDPTSGQARLLKDVVAPLRDEFRTIYYDGDFAYDLIRLKICKPILLEGVMRPGLVTNHHHIVATMEDPTLEFDKFNILGLDREFHGYIHCITSLVQEDQYFNSGHSKGAGSHLLYAFREQERNGRINQFNLLNQPNYPIPQDFVF